MPKTPITERTGFMLSLPDGTIQLAEERARQQRSKGKGR